ncbi:hypothetical protein JTB14_009637 [Gonioctena quinquepunctata]|nr:hypothetical protein JTB14_009637 [Gonioctena quinquepunctata]
MASKHSGDCVNSLNTEYEVKLEVKSENDSNVGSKEGTIKEEPVENEPSSEHECDSYLEELQDEKILDADLVKLEHLRTGDFDDNLPCEMEDSEVVTDDEDKKPLKKVTEEVRVKEENLQDFSEDTAASGDVKIEEEIDIKNEEVKIETDEEELDEDTSDQETAGKL